MRKLFLVVVLIVVAVFGSNLWDMKKDKFPLDKYKSEEVNKNRFFACIDSARTFLNRNDDFNAKTAFFIDMKIQSGKNRFFIYNFDQNKIVDQGLVAHGSGSETAIEGKLKFSNTDNSHCTSLGKYSIGKSYDGQFGKAYKLYGLDKTNSNAFLRNIVLHKYHKVPYEEQEEPICNSYGCPMVNEKFYTRLEKIIDASDKTILLYIYY